jgi:hypothetical protein
MKTVFLAFLTAVVFSQQLVAKDPSPFSGTWTGVTVSTGAKPGRYWVIVWGKTDFTFIQLITDAKPNATEPAVPLASSWRGKYSVHDSVIIMESVLGSKRYRQKLRWSVNEGALILQSDDGESTWFLTRAVPGPYLDP